MKKNYWIALFFICFMVACGSTESTTEEASETSPVAENNEAGTVEEGAEKEPATLELEPFAEFPEEIDGCSCYFSQDQESFDNNKFIYVDNFEDQAYVILNGEKCTFQLSEEDTGDETSIKKMGTYQDYEMIIELKDTQEESDQEIWKKAGTLTIQANDGDQLVLKISGECGC